MTRFITSVRATALRDWFCYHGRAGQVLICPGEMRAAREIVMIRLIRPNRRVCCICLQKLAPQVVLALLAGRVQGNEQYERWPADKPYTLAGYGTHDYGGGGKLEIDCFLDSGLNTAHDTRSNANSREVPRAGHAVPVHRRQGRPGW